LRRAGREVLRLRSQELGAELLPSRKPAVLLL
jgi:hypothetical protein